jgi:protein arginine kinase activator
MKCEKCPNAATLHITEILGENHIEELHLCEVCAQKYLNEPNPPKVSAKAVPLDDLEDATAGHQECENCGLKFVDFRNTGRLGCPHDYDVFREELVQLLENIHGETRHVGKVPRRAPDARRGQAELIRLRKALSAAVNKEQYEEAARIRDRIKRLEEH